MLVMVFYCIINYYPPFFKINMYELIIYNLESIKKGLNNVRLSNNKTCLTFKLNVVKSKELKNKNI